MDVIAFPRPNKVVHFVRKDEYWILRLFAWFLDTFKFLSKEQFNQGFWTTIGHTIGVKTTIDIKKIEIGRAHV